MILGYRVWNNVNNTWHSSRNSRIWSRTSDCYRSIKSALWKHNYLTSPYNDCFTKYGKVTSSKEFWNSQKSFTLVPLVAESELELAKNSISASYDEIGGILEVVSDECDRARYMRYTNYDNILNELDVMIDNLYNLSMS